MLPLLDRWQLEGWRSDRPSILCLSPLKALLDDQLHRWRRATALVGASAFAWHGDVGIDEKRAFRADPTDVLLSTPESLELLVSNAEDRRRLAGIRAVVIDEAHAFVGHPRGAQVASLLERLETIAEEDIQRIALSATVADRGAVVSWLRGRSLREAGAVDGGRATIGEVVKIRSHENLDEAVTTIAHERLGRRCLVFAGSRRRVEELALRLGCAAHHSSVSGDRRADALHDLRSGATDLVVTSSSLEMGIDVGDLDLVIHDGPPPGPTSYLQRLGRAGRRSGHRAITFLVGSPDDLLLVLATVLRARREDLDPVNPTRGARLVLGQQALLLTLQKAISSRQELYETLRFSPVFAELGPAIDATIDHLVATGYLAARGDMLALGAEGQRRYGGRVRDLLATFTGSTDATVVDQQGNAIGEIDWSLVEAQDGPARRDGLVLGGARWQVVTVQESLKRVIVSPGGTAVARGWRGASMPVSRATWGAAREVLMATDVPSDSDARADAWLDELRRAWRPRLAIPVVADDVGVVAHTFAGDQVHRAVLHAFSIEGQSEGPTLYLSATPGAVRSAAAEALANLGQVLDVEAARLAAFMPVAHRALCAPAVLVSEARQFEVDEGGIESVLTLLATWPS
jgi:ATP-dependent Lhr-like helicase